MRLIILLLVNTILLLQVAAQTKDSILAQIAKLQLTPTEIGKPDGESVSQKIGAKGGTIISSDKKVELTIPEGALSSETLITIQPSTNPMESAIGKSYSFEPSGIQFHQAVQLVFHYTDGELDGDSPQLTNISFQDDKGVWYGLKKVKVDTLVKTITGEIKHFSMWAIGWSFTFRAEKSNVKVSSGTVIYAYANPIGEETKGDREDMVNDLYGSDFSKPRIWSVNGIVRGNNEVGTIDGNLIMIVGYTAPASVPDQNPVEVKLEIIGGTNGFSDGNFTRKCKIHIYDSRYEVRMDTKMNGSAGTALGDVEYTDFGSFIVQMEGKKTRIVNIKNEKDFYTYHGTCQVTRIHAGNGMLHIAGIKGLRVTPAQAPKQPYSIVEIAFIPGRVDFSILKLVCPEPTGGNTTITTAAMSAMLQAIPILPVYIKFVAKEGEQTILEKRSEGGEIYYKFSVRKLSE